MEEENWLPVVGYEGLYEVSDLGRVRSLDRLVAVPGNWRVKQDMVHRRRGLLLKLSAGKRHRYVSVGLHALGKTIRCKVHRLVLQAFLGPHPSDRPYVNHKDLNRSNNRLDNLEYCSPMENIAHAKENGRLHKWSREVSVGRVAKITVAQAFGLMADGELNGKQIDSTLGLPSGFAAALRRGDTWTAPPGASDRPEPKAAGSAVNTPGRRRVLSLEQARAIFDAASLRVESQSSIARRYGIHQSTVSDILRGRSWEGITSPA